MFFRHPLESYAVHLGKHHWLGAASIKDEDKTDLVWCGQGPDDVPIYALRNGFLIFDFASSEFYSGGAIPDMPLENGKKIPPKILKLRALRNDLRYKRFAYMNAYMITLHSSYIEIQKSGGSFVSMLNPTSYYKARVDYGKYEIFTAGELKPEFPTGEGAMFCETLQNSTELLTECKTVFGDGYVELLSLTTQACSQYSDHQFSAAHLSAWCISESMLQHMWKEYQNKSLSHTKINSDRKSLLNGRDYSASAISQILSLAGILEDDILVELDSARKLRNSFAHSLTRIGSNQASAAIATAAKMIGKVLGREFHPKVGYFLYD